MCSTKALVNTSLSFSPFEPVQFVSGNSQWNAIFSAKNHRKTSAESCGTTTTADESFSGKDSSSSNVESPNVWESKVSIDSHDDCVLNSTLKPKKKAAVDETKYKTELCRKYENTGYCPYGKKCKFAHGKEELNEKFLNNKRRYKSKKCNSFHSTMQCPYGSRCLFAHEERPLEEIQSVNYYEKFLFCPELLTSGVANRKRLPCFGNVTSSEVNSLTSITEKIGQEFDDEYNEIFKMSSCQ
jgi:hypothetical protein